jgi:hypothetical protein
MDTRERNIIYLVSLAIYASLGVYNALAGSQWFWDNVIAIGILTLVTGLNDYLKLGRTGFFALNLALIVHNLGSFGLYELRYGLLAYDNLVHLLGSIVAAYIVFNYIARILHDSKRVKMKKTVVDEHMVIVMLLVIASVAMLGALVELAEFAGWKYLGPGEGMLFVGAGDGGYSESEWVSQYEDTMEDILVNVIGSSIGVLVFYKLKYKKKFWMRNRI